MWARTVAEVIREHIAVRDITQRDLARRAGVHPSTITRCLRGQRSLSLDEMARIAAALGLTPTHLIQRAHMTILGTEPTLPPDDSPLQGASAR